jgi:hypothetical protein
VPAIVPADLALWVTGELAALPGADSGALFASRVPEWIWIGFAAGVVIALSKECRDGLTRLGRQLRTLDRGRRLVLASTLVGALLGAALGAAS